MSMVVVRATAITGCTTRTSSIRTPTVPSTALQLRDVDKVDGAPKNRDIRRVQDIPHATPTSRRIWQRSRPSQEVVDTASKYRWWCSTARYRKFDTHAVIHTCSAPICTAGTTLVDMLGTTMVLTAWTSTFDPTRTPRACKRCYVAYWWHNRHFWDVHRDFREGVIGGRNWR